MVILFAAKATWTLLHVRKNLLNTPPLNLSNVTLYPSNGLLPLDLLDCSTTSAVACKGSTGVE